MTRVFTEGAEFQDLLFWTGKNGSPIISTSVKRSGTASYRVATGGNEYYYKDITPITEGYWRIGWRFDNYSFGDVVFKWYYAANLLGQLKINATSHKMELYVSSTLVNTGSIELVSQTFYLLEIHIKIANSGGAIEFKIDGVADASFSGDTQPGSDTTISRLQYGDAGGSNLFYFDDLAMNNTNGSVDNSWCNDGHVILMIPDSNGDVSQLLGSDGNSTDNYLLVDDVPPNGDTDFVESSTLNEYDLYNLAASGLTGTTIRRAWAEARAKDTVAEGGLIALVLKTLSTEYDGTTDFSLLTSYTRVVGTDHPTNPNTGSAWTVAQLDALQVGPKVRS